MDFCEKCGGLMLMKEKGSACATCGKKSEKKVKIQSSEKTIIAEEIAVVQDGADETNPIIDMICQKCKNKKCYFWTLQTRSSDESETKFYKCVKCKHTWRAYR